MLKTFELRPRGNGGWTSKQQRLGSVSTLLLGPNGSGKTPLIKALVYALGLPVEIPPLVREKCASCVIEFGVDDQTYRLERQLTSSGVAAIVSTPSGESKTINDERALSEWVLPRLGLPLRTLTGKAGEKVAPYMSVVGPMFLVDQDVGWTAAYVPFETHQFVKDQREEVTRWILDVPSRHTPVDKSEFESAKTNLSSIREQIAFKRRALEALQRELGEDRAGDARERLDARRIALETDLTRVHSVLETLAKTESVLDARVREEITRRDEVTQKATSLRRRKEQLLAVQGEVSAELSAVEQNEIAAEAFRSLCSSDACMFFRKPEESYGRRVLYLKDQLKDFESSTGETERQLEVLQEQFKAAEAAVSAAVEENKRRLQKVGGSDAINAVRALSVDLASVHVRLDRLQRIDREKKQLEALIDKEARAVEAVKELRPTSGPRKDGSRLLDARQALAKAFNEWLVVLNTPNVAADATFDEELRPVIGGERFAAKSSYSGSTRTRIVLAYHAAMVEAALQLRAPTPRLLVLDAPRQHELAAPDLRAYLARFHSLSAKQDEPVQLVFSAIDRAAVPKGVDDLWEPPFAADGKPRFLGSPEPQGKPA